MTRLSTLAWSFTNSVALLDIGSGRGAINLVGMASAAPYPMVWLENPREHGGNARTDPWIARYIGPAFDALGSPAAFGSGDFNNDGRMDVAAARSEGDLVPIPGALFWWEAPVNRRSGVWVQHMIDATYTSAHNLRIADMDGNGSLDIVTAEQEQSEQRRVSVFYNDGLGEFSELVLSNGSGHNITLGDLDGDGELDILNAGHGYFGAPHPVEIYINHMPSSGVRYLPSLPIPGGASARRRRIAIGSVAKPR